jgi:hypothetical protein
MFLSSQIKAAATGGGLPPHTYALMGAYTPQKVAASKRPAALVSQCGAG